jgi:protein-tyrosine phosphatase
VIDLHCHILPGLDDGARSLQDSVAMARQAEEDGIAIVCATPHVRSDHNVRVEEIEERVADVQRALDDRSISVLVLPGGELAQAQAEHLSDAQLRLVSLGGGGRWLLLEPSPGPLDDELEKLAEGLAERGFSTVLAHPERHAGAGFRERLQGLVDRGCLIQWTAEFLARSPRGDLTVQLAADGFVHLLGSDAHSASAGRPVRLAAAFARLRQVRTAEQIEWMSELAPAAIVRGDPVSPQP